MFLNCCCCCCCCCYYYYLLLERGSGDTSSEQIDLFQSASLIEQPTDDSQVTIHIQWSTYYMFIYIYIYIGVRLIAIALIAILLY